MSAGPTFLSRLEAKVTQQLSSQRVGYLIGAGASFLSGQGYPLAEQLWAHIGPKVRNPERGEIQAKLDGGANGIEQALDLLDDGSAIEKPHRHLVTEAIADHFLSLKPPTDRHQLFLRRVGRAKAGNPPLGTLC